MLVAATGAAPVLSAVAAVTALDAAKAAGKDRVAPYRPSLAPPGVVRPR